jgi:hypothetical protein
MSFTITDNTASTQRFASDNSTHIELGHGTPSGELTVNGKSVLTGAVLSQKVAASQSMVRAVGSVALGALGTTTTISVATAAGFGTINGVPSGDPVPATVIGYNSARTQFTVLSVGAVPSANYGNF